MPLLVTICVSKADDKKKGKKGFSLFAWW